MSKDVHDADPMKTALDRPLKAVMPSVPEWILEERRKTGADWRDEMWEGVLHMAPEASPEHDDINGDAFFFLKLHLGRRFKVLLPTNLSPPDPPGGWTRNFRIPDIMIARLSPTFVRHASHYEGTPDVVVEVRSPGDESEEKLPFYAVLGVMEAWLIDRDTKEPRVLALMEEGSYVQRPAGPDGWIRSEVTGVEMRARGGKLELRLAGDASTLARIPED
jgi:Uma2 family endonuclease